MTLTPLRHCTLKILMPACRASSASAIVSASPMAAKDKGCKNLRAQNGLGQSGLDETLARALGSCSTIYQVMPVAH